MLETIFQYSLLSFFLSIVLMLVALVKFQIKPWQLLLMAIGLTYPGAVIANHFGAQLLLLVLLVFLGAFGGLLLGLEPVLVVAQGVRPIAVNAYD